MQYKLIVGIVMLLGVVAITGAGCGAGNQNTSNPVDTSTSMMEKEVMIEKEKIEVDKTMMEKEKTMTPEEKMMEKNTIGMYKDYSPAALVEATKDGGKAVLFFWASWCPNCKAANADFLAHTNQIPNNVTVFKTNYDTEKTLKTKYGVTYQHTFVQVDAQGNQITKWNGGGIADLLTNLK